ncbi:MAG: hypothetical protein ACI8RD_013700, partial [Bacillariaceae sp.]
KCPEIEEPPASVAVHTNKEVAQDAMKESLHLPDR